MLLELTCAQFSVLVEYKYIVAAQISFDEVLDTFVSILAWLKREMVIVHGLSSRHGSPSTWTGTGLLQIIFTAFVWAIFFGFVTPLWIVPFN